MIPNPLAPRASIYSDEIPHRYYGSDIPDVGNAYDIPHAVDTPEVIETIVTYGGDAVDNAAAVVAAFNFYGYVMSFIIVIMVIGFLLDR